MLNVFCSGVLRSNPYPQTRLASLSRECFSGFTMSPLTKSRLLRDDATPDFPALQPGTRAPRVRSSLVDELTSFAEFGQNTRIVETTFPNADETVHRVPTFVNEFWTARQRQAHSLHEVSYRACFKPQLPRFFIERLTRPGDVVYDPFMGRGTTLIEAALLGRVPFGGDVNPLSAVFTRPRLNPPALFEVENRLRQINFSADAECRDDLEVFYHPETLREIAALRKYFLQRIGAPASGAPLDAVDDWLRLVAVNRLTGHSAGFFSVYTLPPNQAVSLKSQQKINTRRNQTP